jgi:hypothetical protein
VKEMAAAHRGGRCQSLPIALPKTEAVISRKDDRIEAEKLPEPEAALGLHSERPELSNAVSGRTDRENSECPLKLQAESSDFDSAIRRVHQLEIVCAKMAESPQNMGLFRICSDVSRLQKSTTIARKSGKSPTDSENIPIFGRLSAETFFSICTGR